MFVQGLYGSWRSWKVLEFYCHIFQDWKVLENTTGLSKSWKSVILNKGIKFLNDKKRVKSECPQESNKIGK